MSEPWDGVRDQVFSIVKDALNGFVERAEVDAFVREKAQEYSREWWGSIHGASEEEKAEHFSNLEHIKAHVKSEFDRLQIQISVDAKNTIVKILEAVGGILIKVAPKLLAAAI